MSSGGAIERVRAAIPELHAARHAMIHGPATPVAQRKRGVRKHHVELGALSFAGLDPDLTVVLLDDPEASGEPDAAALVSIVPLPANSVVPWNPADSSAAREMVCGLGFPYSDHRSGNLIGRLTEPRFA